jgi:hypothetical protein
VSSVISRLKHHGKILGGNLIGKRLSKRYHSGQGPAARLISVFSSQARAIGVQQNVLLPSRPVEKLLPEFYLDGSVEAEYRNLLSFGPGFTRPAGVASARCVDVSLPTGMHQVGKNILEEAMPAPYLLTNPKYYFALESIKFRKKRLMDEGFWLAMPWSHNFYHWMIDSLPRLLSYDRSPQLHGVPIIVPKSAPRFVLESLGLTGYRSKTVLLESGVYRFKKLHMPTMLSDPMEVSPDAIDWLDRNFSGTSTRPTQPNRRLYVSRGDAKIRFISNEAQLANILSHFGFETVVMSSLSLAEQISLFRGAECIIGPHGAAFANLAFANPGTIFIEFFPRGHFTPSDNRLAGVRNLKYGFIISEPAAMGGYSVDPGQLRTVLSRALPR